VETRVQERGDTVMWCVVTFTSLHCLRLCYTRYLWRRARRLQRRAPRRCGAVASVCYVFQQRSHVRASQVVVLLLPAAIELAPFRGAGVVCTGASRTDADGADTSFVLPNSGIVVECAIMTVRTAGHTPCVFISRPQGNLASI
jgi:hypothetical protein